MNADQLVQQATNFLFVVIFVSVALAAVRRPQRQTIDAAALFGALALAIVVGQVASALDLPRTEVYDDAVGILAMALPYLLLRLVEDVHEVPRWAMRAALAGYAASAIGFVLFQTPLPPSVTVALVAYFAASYIYAFVAFLRERQRSSGVSRRRMASAALGSLLLGLAILPAGLASVLPFATAITRVLALASAVAYALAFATPGLLRRAWREPDLRHFLGRIGSATARTDVKSLASEIERAAARVLGAKAAGLGLLDESRQILRFAEGAEIRAGDGPIGQVLREQRPMLFTGDDLRERFPEGARLFETHAVRSVLAAPVTLAEQPLGVLTIYSDRHSLFSGDDLDLVAILARHAALAIEGARSVESLRRLNRELEARVSDLFEANRKLEEATRAKSEFLANMSHELRTPLNAILGFSELLAEQLAAALSAEQQRFLRNVQDAGRHLLDLINEVLDLSKVEAGRIELRSEVIRLGPLVEPTVAAARTLASAGGAAFHADIEEDVSVRVDPGRVRQVLFNLLSNAVKFTPRGGSVRLRAVVQESSLHLDVTDTGIGIPADKHGRVFGMFERLHEGRTEVNGTGLGLALTKRLVELHGGTISFESDVGRGSTFRVRLPDVEARPIHGDRVLVVEDVNADSELIVALAKEVGLRSEVVMTVEAAVEAVRRDLPLGVVLDLRLPDERGERVLEAIKAEAATRWLPVVVVTVEDDDGRSRPLGADDHLTKPIDRQRLTEWLRRLRPVAEDVGAHPPR